MKVRLFADAMAAAGAVADEVVRAARQAITCRGVFHWMLAGGRTPELCYRQLREAEIDWRHVHIWFGDERCLPAGDRGRNDSMARQALLDHVPLPAAQLHAVPAELGPQRAAASYAAALAGAPAMDMVLLGMGEDGHTAGLFPDHPALRDERPVIPVLQAPKPPAGRVSTGFSVLNRARQCIMLVTGSGKHEALMRIHGGEQLPAACLRGCDWYVDAAAWDGAEGGGGLA